jgi:hypothetical protein
MSESIYQTCAFCDIDESNAECIKYRCKLTYFLFFKEDAHVTYTCDYNGNPDNCKVLELCRRV